LHGGLSTGPKRKPVSTSAALDKLLREIASDAALKKLLRELSTSDADLEKLLHTPPDRPGSP
jgi:hypothetical protein